MVPGRPLRSNAVVLHSLNWRHSKKDHAGAQGRGKLFSVHGNINIRAQHYHVGVQRTLDSGGQTLFVLSYTKSR